MNSEIGERSGKKGWYLIRTSYMLCEEESVTVDVGVRRCIYAIVEVQDRQLLNN